MGGNSASDFWEDPVEELKPRRHVPWARLIKGNSPSELIRVVATGDPFGLKGRAAKRIHELALFLDSEHLYSRVIARVSYECARLRKRPRADRILPWVVSSIDKSVNELTNEDNEILRQGNLAFDKQDPRYAFMTETLGLPGATSRARCVAFNGLDIEVRRAFYAIAIAGVSVKEAVQHLGAPASTLHDRVLTASNTLVGPPPADGSTGGQSS